jgi:hypothetical protein
VGVKATTASGDEVGVLSPFLSESPIIPYSHRVSGKQGSHDSRYQHGIIMEYLEKEATEVAPTPLSLGFYASTFLRQNKSGKWRAIINLKPLNQHLVKYKFHMLTPKELSLTLQKGHWTTSVDLSDAYLRIPIDVGYRNYLRLVHRGVVYQFKSFPFGLSDSPYVFTRVMKVVLQAAQSNRFQISGYLDDWLNRGFNPTRVDYNHRWLELLCLNLGLIVKSGETRTNTNPKAYLHRYPMGPGVGEDVSNSEPYPAGHSFGLGDIDVSPTSTCHAVAAFTGTDVGHGKNKFRGGDCT